MSLKRYLFVGANRFLMALPAPARRIMISAISKLPFDAKRPRFMAIEPTNTCNLNCPLCPVGAKTMGRDYGFMNLEKYKRLVDEISHHTNRILMNFAGEPLLHPHIGEMVKYAEQSGIRITLGTHGNIDKMQDLIDASVSEVLFSLDGATEEIYQQYRIGGKIDLALANLKKLTEARDRAPNSQTRVILQFVVMKHNKHQIRQIVEIGREFGVDEISLQPVCVNDFFVEEQNTLIEKWVPEDSHYLLHPEAANGGEMARPPLCVWAIQSVVLFNGDVTVCCFDADGSNVMGNAFEAGGFEVVWQSPQYRKKRQQVVRQDLAICKKCDIGLPKATRFSPMNTPFEMAETRNS